MAGLFFLIAVLLGGAAVLFQQAAAQLSVGTSWAHSVCHASPLFCGHPEYLAYGGGALLVVAIGVKLASLVQG